MDEMNAEMKQAEKHITGMEKWCGLCVCPWNRSSKTHLYFTSSLCSPELSNCVQDPPHP